MVPENKRWSERSVIGPGRGGACRRRSWFLRRLAVAGVVGSAERLELAVADAEGALDAGRVEELASDEEVDHPDGAAEQSRGAGGREQRPLEARRDRLGVSSSRRPLRCCRRTRRIFPERDRSFAWARRTARRALPCDRTETIALACPVSWSPFA